MWWKFKRHKLARVSAVVLLVFYLLITVSEFVAPYALQTRHVGSIYAPPMAVHVVRDGSLHWPFVYGRTKTLDMKLLKRIYTDDPSKPHPLRFFCKGDSYRFWGLVRWDRHLFCAEGGEIFLLGADRLGRDMFSRIVYGARISLTIGLLGIAISFTLGITIGGAAGYYGGWVDVAVQRLIEVLQSIPSIPLWMALAAILPVTWSPDPDLFRHHADPRPARLDRASRARSARSCCPCARRTTSPPRRSWGQGRGASSCGIWCPAS